MSLIFYTILGSFLYLFAGGACVGWLLSRTEEDYNSEELVIILFAWPVFLAITLGITLIMSLRRSQRSTGNRFEDSFKTLPKRKKKR